jgi:hypothetical protein
LTASLAAAAWAEDPAGAPTEPPGAGEVPSTAIYGESLMSQDELQAYREKLSELTLSEREAFLQRHREEMDQRARSLGVTLRDETDPVADEAGTGSSEPGRVVGGATSEAGALAGGEGVVDGSAGAPTDTLPASEADIYGRELMTTEEIRAYLAEIEPLEGVERERFVEEHRERMAARARERDAQLPPVGSGASDGHSAHQH